ncbi:MAG: nucleotidyl transferase AbiEii/AbiGii toxin family protein [Chloracidobacterium sp.]|nr:nucleotidyl transferase AbiEii/AbiGii toxin family protein [Chloracidobacterium sp.]MDW8217834.1 nucleotidyl transferase AbiEii/AbiGii toxin family protein [Acidobacteriota bacterium]
MTPRLDQLLPAQLALWPQLAPCAGLRYVLYGGTAITLWLGHRVSVDFDFFTDQPLDRKRLRAALPWLKRSLVIQDRPETLTVLASPDTARCDTVKVSFFGGIGFGRVGEPSLTADGVAWVASLEDLMASKLKVMLQRISSKDYLDVAALLDAGVDLAVGLAAARALWGDAFQPMESLKALAYFEGGDLATLPATVRQKLIAAAARVAHLPLIPRKSTRLSPDEQPYDQ